MKADLLKFWLTISLLALFAAYCSTTLPKGSVWANHLADGILFMSGALPETPAYPMWGYSLLAGLLKEGVIILQLALLLLVFGLWYRSLLNHRTRLSPDNSARMIDVPPVAAAIALAPFICLSLSYFSNSLAQLFAFAGTWVLYLAVQEDKPIIHYVLAGVMVGLGFHFRSELLLMGVLLFAASLIYSISNQRRIGVSVAFFLAFCVTVLPWVVYTKNTINQPRLSSTNGGAAIYLGLGILPDNPWGIVESDEYVGKISNERKLGSPWSAAANSYFLKRYIESIEEHPNSFAKRVAWGWRYMLTQGVYLPKLRLFFAENDREAESLHYVDEKLRLVLYQNVHEEELTRLGSIGISDSTVSLRHYVIVGIEYILRIAYAGIFLLMLGLSIFLASRNRFRNFATIILLAYVCFLLFGAGFMQTNPRHTTIAVPIFLLAICVLPYSYAARRDEVQVSCS